jgi:hypothetical protein
VAQPGQAATRLAANADLAVVDGGPLALGLGGSPNLLVVAPPPASGAGIGAAVGAPHLTDQNPHSTLLRDVDLRSLVLYSGVRAALPPWAHADLQGSAGPLLYSGRAGGQRVAVLLIDPVEHGDAGSGRTGSNLSTLEAFPILVRNAVEALTPAPPAAADAGEALPVSLVRRRPVWLQPPAGRALALDTAGVVAVVPPLSSGLYSLHGGTTGQLAVNVVVPQDPLAEGPLAQGVAPPERPAATADARVPASPAQLWPLLIVLLLVLLGGEWWSYVRRT